MKFSSIFLIPVVLCQNYNWTWISGSNNLEQTASYFVRGGYPGARDGHAGVINPFTAEFVLFGGLTTNNGRRNDLWSYSFETGEWTWLSGTSRGNEDGDYGPKGTAKSSNLPGSRDFHTIDIHPLNGDLVLFGGYGNDHSGQGCLNDLWTYNFNTRLWTWVSGSDDNDERGSYGTLRTASSFNVPGGRYSHSMNIHPKTGNLVVFGGYGYASQFTQDCLNDLWSFSFNTKMWTWLSGSSTNGQLGVYGTKGISSSANIPGCRYSHSSLILPNDGNFLLFGGSNTDSYDDLWSFNFTTYRWTWIGGSNVPNQAGVYGTKGIADTGNTPGARSHQNVIYVENWHSLIMFGGLLPGGGYANDVWVYNLNSGQWTWVAGSNLQDKSGVYGSKRYTDSGNYPGGRINFAFVYVKALSKCALFGGFGYGPTTSNGKSK